MKIKQNKRVKWLSVLLMSAGCLAVSQVGVASTFDATAVSRCQECHAEAVKNFKEGNTHYKAWQFRKDDKNYSCETCHGPGEKHMKDKSIESIISFSPEKVSKRTSQEQAAQCLTCHSTQTKELMFWSQGIHNRNDVTCANCHTMHGGAEKMKPTSETCFKCHKDVKNQAGKYSHHPIIEGKVGCNDCHNPHGTLGHGNLRADSVNQLCYKCHADKRGPFVFEHPPVEENCLKCHTPHGSNHEKLLVQKSPALCQDCHSDSGHPGNPWDAQAGFNGPKTGTWKLSPRLYGRGCVNCHSNIHGSNSVGTNGMRFGR